MFKSIRLLPQEILFDLSINLNQFFREKSFEAETAWTKLDRIQIGKVMKIHYLTIMGRGEFSSQHPFRMKIKTMISDHLKHTL